MRESVKKEIEKIIMGEDLAYSVEGLIAELNDTIYKIPIEEVPSLEGKTRVCRNTTFWSDICRKYDLTENFMREFIDLLHWPHMSGHQDMSIEFIRDFKHLIHWSWHKKRNDLSFDFIFEFEDYLDLQYMAEKDGKYSIWRNSEDYFGGYNNFSIKEYNLYKYRLKQKEFLGREEITRFELMEIE